VPTPRDRDRVTRGGVRSNVRTGPQRADGATEVVPDLKRLRPSAVATLEADLERLVARSDSNANEVLAAFRRLGPRRTSLSPAACLAVIEAARELEEPGAVVAVAREFMREHHGHPLAPRVLWEAAAAQLDAGRTDLSRRTLTQLARTFRGDPHGEAAWAQLLALPDPAVALTQMAGALHAPSPSISLVRPGPARTPSGVSNTMQARRSATLPGLPLPASRRAKTPAAPPPLPDPVESTPEVRPTLERDPSDTESDTSTTTLRRRSHTQVALSSRPPSFDTTASPGEGGSGETEVAWSPGVAGSGETEVMWSPGEGGSGETEVAWSPGVAGSGETEVMWSPTLPGPGGTYPAWPTFADSRSLTVSPVLPDSGGTYPASFGLLQPPYDRSSDPVRWAMAAPAFIPDSLDVEGSLGMDEVPVFRASFAVRGLARLNDDSLAIMTLVCILNGVLWVPVLFLAVQGTMIGCWGQSIGKSMLDLQVVRADGSSASLVRIVLRGLVLLLFHVLPLLFVVDAVRLLFVRVPSRSLHDLIAGTDVAPIPTTPLLKVASGIAAVAFMALSLGYGRFLPG